MVYCENLSNFDLKSFIEIETNLNLNREMIICTITIALETNVEYREGAVGAFASSQKFLTGQHSGLFDRL